LKRIKIKCDNCNKLIKVLWSVTIKKENWESWELHFCSKTCLEKHRFKLVEEELN